MRIIFGSVLAIFAVIIVAVIAIPFMVSTDWIKEQVVETVNAKTGRSLTIAGKTSLSVFPNLSLTVGQVAFSNRAGQDGDLVTMEELDVGLKLLPLLSGGVEVDRLILTRPVFALEVDANGVKNWAFSEQGAAGENLAASAQTNSDPQGESGSGVVPNIEAVQLGDVRIVDGEVSYKDVAAGSFQQVSQINATLELPSLAEPMKLTGTLQWQGEEVTFSTEITEPQALTTGTPTAVALDVEAPQLALQVSGNLAIKDGFAIEGTIETSTPSVKKMARWLDAAVPDVAGLNGFSLKAGLNADETGIALDNAVLTLDDITAEGGLLVGIGGPKPVVRATLAASRINLDNYIGSGGGGSSSGGKSASGSGSSSGGGSNGSGGGWSDEPIDLSGLRAVDADFRVSAAGLNIGKIEVGQSALAITLKDAILSVDLSELQLYEGRAAGKLTVNGASETPAIAVAYNIDNVSAHPLLAAAADFDWIEGRGKITGSLASRGTTQRALVSALNGETRLLFTNGAIRGVNIAQMARNMSLGSIGLSDNSQQKTDFSEFSASFAINRGIAQTNDIKILGPLVRVSGAGVADLPNRSLDFRIVPKIVASILGQGAADDLLGLEIPVLIRGPWSGPTIAPDVGALLKDPAKVIEAVKDIGDAVGNIIKDNPAGALEEVVRKPGDLLNQLTGGGQEQQGAAPIGDDIFKRLLGQ